MSVDESEYINYIVEYVYHTDSNDVDDYSCGINDIIEDELCAILEHEHNLQAVVGYSDDMLYVSILNDKNFLRKKLTSPNFLDEIEINFEWMVARCYGGEHRELNFNIIVELIWESL